MPSTYDAHQNGLHFAVNFLQQDSVQHPANRQNNAKNPIVVYTKSRLSSLLFIVPDIYFVSVTVASAFNSRAVRPKPPLTQSSYALQQ